MSKDSPPAYTYTYTHLQRRFTTGATLLALCLKIPTPQHTSKSPHPSTHLQKSPPLNTPPKVPTPQHTSKSPHPSPHLQKSSPLNWCPLLPPPEGIPHPTHFLKCMSRVVSTCKFTFGSSLTHLARAGTRFSPSPLPATRANTAQTPTKCTIFKQQQRRPKYSGTSL